MDGHGSFVDVPAFRGISALEADTDPRPEGDTQWFSGATQVVIALGSASARVELGFRHSSAREARFSEFAVVGRSHARLPGPLRRS